MLIIQKIDSVFTESIFITELNVLRIIAFFVMRSPYASRNYDDNSIIAQLVVFVNRYDIFLANLQ